MRKEGKEENEEERVVSKMWKRKNTKLEKQVKSNPLDKQRSVTRGKKKKGKKKKRRN